MSRFLGKTVLVTGAGRGIGAALAAGFAREGAHVALADLDESAAVEQARTLSTAGYAAHPHALDVRDVEQCRTVVAAVMEQRGGIDVLINNAGILIRDPFDTGHADDAFARTFDVNLHGMVRMTEACLPHLKARRGAVLNIASIQSFASLRNSVAYTTSKAAVAQFTKALAVELAPAGVRVNALAPGIIETDISAFTRSDPARIAKFLERVPAGRTGQPQDLVEPALFLCSAGAAYVTGAILPVDGGFLAL